MFLIVLLYAILASTFVFAKNALDYAEPIFLIGFRMTFSGTILLSYLLLFNRKKFKIAKGDLFLFSKVAFFHVYLAFICEFWSLQYLSSSKTNLIYSLTPFIAAALSFFLLKELLSNMKIFGLLLGMVGIIPIMILQTSTFETETEFLSISLPDIVLLVAVVSASYAWFDIKKLMARGYSLALINGFAMFAGGLGAFITYFSTEGFDKPAIKDFWPFFQYVMLLIIFSNVIFYNMYGFLLKKYSITFLTFAGFLSPFFGTFFGWFFRGEEITWHYWVSLSAITCALFIFYREELTQPALLESA